MKKYILELSEEQLLLVARCLEDISRFASGQSELGHTLRAMLKDLEVYEMLKRRAVAEDHLRLAKRALLPRVPDNGGLSYNGSDFIGNTYQIYRSIYYCLAMENDWNNVYSSPSLPSGNMGSVNVYPAC